MGHEPSGNLSFCHHPLGLLPTQTLKPHYHIISPHHHFIHLLPTPITLYYFTPLKRLILLLAPHFHANPSSSSSFVTRVLCGLLEVLALYSYALVFIFILVFFTLVTQRMISFMRQIKSRSNVIFRLSETMFIFSH